MTDAKNKGGRPSEWRPEYAEHCRKVALLGWTDKEMAQSLHVSVRTFYKWKKAQPELQEALRHKEIADAEVLNAIYQAAVGKTVTTKKVLGTGENARVVEVTEHIPPNVMAGMYWLNNRQRSRFSRNPDPITDPDEPIPASVTVTVEDASVDDAEAQ
jgi:hypothetical protein